METLISVFTLFSKSERKIDLVVENGESPSVTAVDHTAIHPAAIVSVRHQQQQQQRQQQPKQESQARDVSHHGHAFTYLALLVVFVGIMACMLGMCGQAEHEILVNSEFTSELQQCPVAVPFL